MIKKYMKTATVKAIQYTGKNISEIKEFVGNKLLEGSNNALYFIDTLEGEISFCAGDYICKGIKGEFWAVERTIFEKTYEEVNDD